jgi:hypothetical protein
MAAAAAAAGVGERERRSLEGCLKLPPIGKYAAFKKESERPLPTKTMGVGNSRADGARGRRREKFTAGRTGGAAELAVFY